MLPDRFIDFDTGSPNSLGEKAGAARYISQIYKISVTTLC